MGSLLRKKILAWMLCIALGFIGTAWGANEPVATIKIEADRVTWQPKFAYEAISLTVSAKDGSLYSQTFLEDQIPFFEPYDNFGNPFPDGTFTYEVRVTPVIDPALKEALADARESGDETLVTALGKQVQESLPPLVQSGSIALLDGVFIMNGGGGYSDSLGLVPEDIVHLDDVIATFSLCVGNDCVNGESFGFDTLRLKENNLRIHFFDTSVSASFPTNDWRIVANDTLNGGGNYLAFEDSTAGRQPFRVDAGAPANALRVDSGGDVGFGTSNPVVELHVLDGNTPTLRLQQDGSSGFTPQTYDIAANEANFFIRDVTNGSKLFFKAKPGAPENSLFIASNGYIGLGTSSPRRLLHVYDAKSSGANNARVVFNNGNIGSTSADGTEMGIDNAGIFYLWNYEDQEIQFATNNTLRMKIEKGGKVVIGDITNHADLEVTGNINATGTITPGSSRDLKENIEGLTTTEALAAVKALDPVKFNYKKVKDDDNVGFIAEDVPELLATKDRRGVNTMDVVAVLTKVVQNQEAVMEQQQGTIGELSRRLAELEQKMVY